MTCGVLTSLNYSMLSVLLGVCIVCMWELQTGRVGIHVVEWLDTGFGLVIEFIAHLQLVTTINYNTALITVTQTSLLSLLQPPLAVAQLQSPNKGYSLCPSSLQTAFTNHWQKTALLSPGPPSSDCLRTHSQSPNSELTQSSHWLSICSFWVGPQRKHFLQLLCWCMRWSVMYPIVTPLSTWCWTTWKTLLPAAASLLSDVSTVAKTCSMCHCLATCLGFQQICHNI
jgi:hypothetical protein